MKSQTGFGRSENINQFGSVTVEIRSVNGRFFEFSLKAPRLIMGLEEQIRNKLIKQIVRGTIEVKISLRLQKSVVPVVDLEMAKFFYEKIKILEKELNCKEPISVDKLLMLPEVIKIEEIEDSKNIWELLEPALNDAINKVLEFKIKEGLHLTKDISSQISSIEKTIAKVEKRVPKMIKENMTNMQNRIKEMLGVVEIDQTKLANEIAFFVDKVDINEEIKRLKSHINQFKETLKDKEAIGKKLEFISQEMTREINTMGSKSNDIEITNNVLLMKNLNEKIKEQIRNIE